MRPYRYPYGAGYPGSNRPQGPYYNRAGIGYGLGTGYGGYGYGQFGTGGGYPMYGHGAQRGYGYAPEMNRLAVGNPPLAPGGQYAAGVTGAPPGGMGAIDSEQQYQYGSEPMQTGDQPTMTTGAVPCAAGGSYKEDGRSKRKKSKGKKRSAAPPSVPSPPRLQIAPSPPPSPVGSQPMGSGYKGGHGPSYNYPQQTPADQYAPPMGSTGHPRQYAPSNAQQWPGYSQPPSGYAGQGHQPPMTYPGSQPPSGYPGPQPPPSYDGQTAQTPNPQAAMGAIGSEQYQYESEPMRPGDEPTMTTGAVPRVAGGSYKEEGRSKRKKSKGKKRSVAPPPVPSPPRLQIAPSPPPSPTTQFANPGANQPMGQGYGGPGNAPY